MGNYTAIVILSCLTICVMSILIFENARMEKRTKYRFYATYAVILVATLSEWAGIALNGAPLWTVGLHRVVKCLDYIFTPVVGICFALQVSDERDWKKHRWLLCVLAANAVLEIASIFTGWTFFVTEENYYDHGPLYGLYTAVYFAAIVDLLIAFRAYSQRFKRHNRISLYSIILLVGLGIAFQELGGKDVRTACVALAFSAVLIFIHYNEFMQQKYDESLAHQRKLIETDALTGLLSRYSYMTALGGYRQAGALPDGLAVFSIDINGLKFVNDTMGHTVGDQVIRHAAECISEVFGQYGKCFRIGGDEFIAILNVDKEKIAEIDSDLDKAEKSKHGLSLSYGYAIAEEHPGLSIEELVNIADKMMYVDKGKHYQTVERDGHEAADASDGRMAENNRDGQV